VTQLPGFGLSMGLTAVSDGVAPFLRALAYGVSGTDPATSEELMRRLATAELRLFILGEQIATLRGLLATLEQGEAAIVDALVEKRRGLADEGTRTFVDAAGAPVDRSGIVSLPQPDGPVTATVAVAYPRFPWRVDIILVAGVVETILGTATSETTTASVTFEPPTAEAGPPGHIEVRVSGLQEDIQPVDGDPATMPGIDLAAAAWAGRESGPDTYRFALVQPTACRPVPAERALDFEQGIGTEWSVAREGANPSGSGRFLGEFDNEAVELTLRSLRGQQVLVSFDLIVARSWDGLTPPYGGPDVWQASIVGGPVLVRAALDNVAGASPQFLALVPGVTLSSPLRDTLGYEFYGDSLIRVELAFTAPADTFVLEFRAEGLQGTTDEAWGIDNVDLRDAWPCRR